MPITKGAKKALRVADRKRVFNLRRKDKMKQAIKTIKLKATPEALALAYQAIDKAAKRGVIKKNNAARKKSRLARLLVNLVK